MRWAFRSEVCRLASGSGAFITCDSPQVDLAALYKPRAHTLECLYVGLTSTQCSDELLIFSYRDRLHGSLICRKMPSRSSRRLPNAARQITQCGHLSRITAEFQDRPSLCGSDGGSLRQDNKSAIEAPERVRSRREGRMRVHDPLRFGFIRGFIRTCLRRGFFEVVCFPEPARRPSA